MVYSTSLNCQSSETLLIGAMRKMFNIDSQQMGPQRVIVNNKSVSLNSEFSLYNFAKSYNNFFRSTFIYESLGMTSRIIGYHALVDLNNPKPTDWAYGFLVGVGTQAMLCKYYCLNILNHLMLSLALSRLLSLALSYL